MNVFSEVSRSASHKTQVKTESYERFKYMMKERARLTGPPAFASFWDLPGCGLHWNSIRSGFLHMKIISVCIGLYAFTDVIFVLPGSSASVMCWLVDWWSSQTANIDTVLRMTDILCCLICALSCRGVFPKLALALLVFFHGHLKKEEIVNEFLVHCHLILANKTFTFTGLESVISTK